jgi:hypothetical protein
MLKIWQIEKIRFLYLENFINKIAVSAMVCGQNSAAKDALHALTGGLALNNA